MVTSTNTAKLNLNLLDNEELEFGDWLHTFQSIHNSNMGLIDAAASVSANGTIPFVSKSANYTVSLTNCGVEIITNSITVGILGSAVPTGKYFVIANTVADTSTINGGGTNINGSATYDVPPNTAVTVVKATALVAY